MDVEEEVADAGEQVMQERPEQAEEDELRERLGERPAERLEPLGRGEARVEQVEQPEEEDEECGAADAIVG